MARAHSNSSTDDNPTVDSIEDARLEKGSVLANSNEAGLVGPHIKSKAEKRLVLKQDLVIIPQLMLLCALSHPPLPSLTVRRLHGLRCVSPHNPF